MRRSLRVALAAVIGLALLSLGGAVVADPDLQQTMKMKVSKFFIYHDVVLGPGEYQIVHDDLKKASGDPCLSIWTMKDGKVVRVLTSSYCKRVPREKIAYAKVSTRPEFEEAGMLRITEVQFAGDSYGHVIDSGR